MTKEFFERGKRIAKWADKNMTNNVKDQTLKTMDLNPKQYRLCQRMLNGHIFQTVLQGLFYWTDNKGNGGSDWIDIPTVAEIME